MDAWFVWELSVSRTIEGPTVNRGVRAANVQHAEFVRGYLRRDRLFLLRPIEDPAQRALLKAEYRIVEMSTDGCLDEGGELRCFDPSGRTQRDPLYRETAMRQARPRLAGEIFDPQEGDPNLKRAFASADSEAETRVGNVPRNSKFIVRFWNAKKKALKNGFDIDWKSPAELNPGIRYATSGQPEMTEAENRSLNALVTPRLSSAELEDVKGITRDSAGVVTVATRDRTGHIRHYRFRGHDDSWTFIGVFDVEE